MPRAGGLGNSTDAPSPRSMRRGRGLVNELMDLGEQFIQGSFGACFGENDTVSSADEVYMPGEGSGDCKRKGKGKGEGRTPSHAGGGGGRETEFALKMALTYRGQDPEQVLFITSETSLSFPTAAKNMVSFLCSRARFLTIGSCPVRRPEHTKNNNGFCLSEYAPKVM